MALYHISHFVIATKESNFLRKTKCEILARIQMTTTILFQQAIALLSRVNEHCNSFPPYVSL